MPRTPWAIALLSLPCAAQQARAEGWELELVPYLWVAGIDGDVTVGDRDLNYDNEKGDNKIDISMRGMLLGVGFVF